MHHGDIWRGIDLLAQKHDLSVSGLAKLAGLDATAFNKSKRVSASGRLRWPSTESLARALDAVGETFGDFADRMDGGAGLAIPLLEYSEASIEGHFDSDGHPIGGGWETVRFPGVDLNDGLYALEITDTANAPMYRPGDRLIVSPHAESRVGDRVVVKTIRGKVAVYEIGRRSQSQTTLKSVYSREILRTVASSELAWVARILWVSQ